MVQQTQHSTFPTKLYDMLHDSSQKDFQHVVSWLPCGRKFQIYDPQKLTGEILGNYFNQTKYKSFLRQLQNYGFSRETKGPGKGICTHKDFIRGRRELCFQIKRTARTKSSSSTTTNPPDAHKKTNNKNPPRTVSPEIPKNIIPSKKMATELLFPDIESDYCHLPLSHTPHQYHSTEKSAAAIIEMGCFEGKTFFFIM